MQKISSAQHASGMPEYIYVCTYITYDADSLCQRRERDFAYFSIAWDRGATSMYCDVCTCMYMYMYFQYWLKKRLVFFKKNYVKTS